MPAGVRHPPDPEFAVTLVDPPAPFLEDESELVLVLDHFERRVRNQAPPLLSGDRDEGHQHEKRRQREADRDSHRWFSR